MKNGMPPIHPGVIIREDYLKPLGKSTEDLAKLLGVSVSYVEKILEGASPVTGTLSLLLGKVFNTTPQFWLNLQNAFDLRTAEIALGEAFLENIKPFEELSKEIPKDPKIQ